MGITVCTNYAELEAWRVARNAQATYTEAEYAEVPTSVSIQITADFDLNPVNAGVHEVAIRPQGAGAISGRWWPVYDGTRATLELRDFVTFTIRGTPNVRLRNMQGTRTQSAGGAFRKGNSAQFVGCIFDAGAQATSDIVTTVTGGGDVVASLIVASSVSGRPINAVSTMRLLRSTVVANGRTGEGLRSEFGDLQVIGSAIIGFPTDVTGSLAAGSTHNATSNGTMLGTSGQTGLTTADFLATGAGSEDYRRATGSTKLGNTGTAIAGVTVDAFGTSLPQGAANDIGSHELAEAGDTTPPTLTSPVGTGGTLTCSGSVTTNEANGTLYTSFSASATAPTALQVEAGQDHTGAAALRAVSQAVSATGVLSVASGAITQGTRFAHYMQRDAAGNRSAVVSSASFSVTSGATVPGAPTIGTAVAGNAQATVNGTAPASNGGSPITGYRSTATPGGSTVTGASLPITHTGLTNGTGYTFTLAAQNAIGFGPESAASNSVTPSAGPPPPTAGFDFHTAAGLVFGALAGSLVGISREVGVSITTRINNATTGALVATLPATVTGANGRLPRLTSASVVAGTTYQVTFVWPDGAVYSITMAAS